MIIVIGIDHSCKDAAVRDKTTITNDDLKLAYKRLIQNDFIEEGAWLVTCGRTECIVISDSVEKITAWYANYFKINKSHIYIWQENAALEHLLATACGLNSKIIGETQILGQIKQSITYAKEHQTLGPKLSFWINNIICSAKEIRKNLGINVCPMSMPSMIKQIVLKQYEKIEKLNLLIIGTGEIGQQSLHFFKNTGLFNIKIIGRNAEKTAQTAKQNKVDYDSLTRIPLVLSNYDIVITATSCSYYLITKALLNNLNLKNKLLFDLSMPKNIDPECNKLSSIKLYNLNYLSELITAEQKIQQDILIQAKELIKNKIETSMSILNSKKQQDTLLNFRQNIETLNDEILNWGLKELEKGENPQDVLLNSLRKLSRKIMHGPTYTMRKAISTNQQDYLHYMQIFLDTLDNQQMEKNEN
jgi:glutamyl-tRNA reductase